MEIPKNLVILAKQGDKDSFGELYEICAEPIFRFILLKIRDKHQAEDLLQETFFKAWKALPQFQPEKGKFSSWLYRIASNVVNDYFRKIYRSPETVELLDIHEGTNGNIAQTQNTIDVQIGLANLQTVLAGMSPLYRQVLELRFLQELSVVETAHILNRSQLAVRLIQYRALKKVREQMRRQYDIHYSKI